ncbi:MAG TPA: hypothetical protein VE604_15885 [Candidatus Polarisedimenticolia bacterium]|nr:hypothetical protein [Candidatus Polarisedimenticolia bacterium]
MKKVLLSAFGAVLLVCHVFAQSSALSEVNRIVGARLSVEYNDDKTSATVHVTNVSNKIISMVRISQRYGENAAGKSISSANLKPGESTTQSMGGSAITAIDLDAIVYADGSLETRNDAVAAEIKEEERLNAERQEKQKEYARAFAPPNPASHMPQEEQIVRNYYSKLSFLAQVGPLSNVIMHGSPKLTEAAVRDLIKDQIHFDLSEFQTGDFAEIETHPWTLLLNPDAPQSVIDVNPSGANIGVNQHNFSVNTYQIAWNKPQSEPERQQERRDLIARGVRSTGASTVKDAVRLTQPGDWSRYASFTVSARLQGQAISYRATFLFADHGRKIAIFDPAIRMPVELNGPFYPTVLVDSVYRELPFFKKWVADNQLSGCKRLKEPEVCCDPETGRCGLASEDVAHSLTLPIDEKDRVALNGLMEPDSAAKKPADAACPVTPDSGTKK